MLKLIGFKEYYGTVGDETKMELNGYKLCVGDVVEMFNKDKESHGLTFVCKNKNYGGFIMGIADSYNDERIAGGWKIELIKSHDYIEIDEQHSSVKVEFDF